MKLFLIELEQEPDDYQEGDVEEVAGVSVSVGLEPTEDIFACAYQSTNTTNKGHTGQGRRSQDDCLGGLRFHP